MEFSIRLTNKTLLNIKQVQSRVSDTILFFQAWRNRTQNTARNKKTIDGAGIIWHHVVFRQRGVTRSTPCKSMYNTCAAMLKVKPQFSSLSVVKIRYVISGTSCVVSCRVVSCRVLSAWCLGFFILFSPCSSLVVSQVTKHNYQECYCYRTFN